MKTIALYFVAVICLNPYSTGSNSNKVKLEKMLDKFVLILILLEVTQILNATNDWASYSES